ncbi:MAG: ribose 5-phosphate isomerase B [Bacteroidales bacterium]|jgi:ribose 5-phosphate isomerase B|nr:ribose 5-phosphate isomerase B [Bacteroidales bacterium]MCK9448748.1 ribose 5-phosphate isomerase B [Bacteroidales bacterium]MDD3702044.1 ribose 5-phosphate isomerase B [Bacteroidales bacterium]MDY0369709.1 ribose 5-phosphate isomerase B [Bacteroidales bacterium]
MSDVVKEIPIASDHAGFPMKQFLIEQLKADGWSVVDLGTYNEQSVDYPDFIHPLAFRINQGEYKYGIILCGSGNGAQMTANKYPHVRAALCWNLEQAILSRKHNDANIISLPGRYVDFQDAANMVHAFLTTPFEGGRHQKRVEKISTIIKK